MSITFETYTKNDIHVEYMWDKYVPHYHCFVGREINGVVHTIKDLTYSTKEQARKSFKRQVNMVKKGEIA